MAFIADIKTRELLPVGSLLIEPDSSTAIRCLAAEAKRIQLSIESAQRAVEEALQQANDRRQSIRHMEAKYADLQSAITKLGG